MYAAACLLIFISLQMLMSVRSGLITATCMLPASTCQEALNVAVETAGWEMASSVWVSTCLENLSAGVACGTDILWCNTRFYDKIKVQNCVLFSRILDFFSSAINVSSLTLYFRRSGWVLCRGPQLQPKCRLRQHTRILQVYMQGGLQWRWIFLLW